MSLVLTILNNVRLNSERSTLVQTEREQWSRECICLFSSDTHVCLLFKEESLVKRYSSLTQ